MLIIDNAQLLLEFRNLVQNAYVQIFLWMIMADIATGLCKGFFVREGNSTKGLMGMVKHLLVAILVIVAYPYLKLMGFESIAISFVLFYIAAYGISIVENLGQLGVPFPEWIRERLAKLKDTTDKDGEK